MADGSCLARAAMSRSALRSWRAGVPELARPQTRADPTSGIRAGQRRACRAWIWGLAVRFAFVATEPLGSLVRTRKGQRGLFSSGCRIAWKAAALASLLD
jgi:hypothetical protein